MIRFDVVGDDRRPPWWRTAIYVVLVAIMSLVSVVYTPLAVESQAPGASTVVVLGIGVALLGACVLPAVLVWRQRYPFTVTLVSAGLPLLIPLGNALPLVALATLIGRRKGPAVWWTSAVVALTTAGVLLRDVWNQPIGASFWKSIFAPVGSDPALEMDLGPTEVIVVGVLQFTLAVGVGLLIRYRREVSRVRESVQEERAVATQLGDELARRDERARIAREVHDALGHRLSLLNLHAGGLEANLPADAQARESAHLVRESAGEAMEDLRSLLDLLREPGLPAEPAVPLSELARTVKSSVAAGQSVNSSILIQDSDRASATLTRAVYRIVQELLTNAGRHAPGDPLFLVVEGDPESGITIDAQNAYRGGWGSRGPGSSRGLTGIRERVALIGGSVQYGIDGSRFRVSVHLPWNAP